MNTALFVFTMCICAYLYFLHSGMILIFKLLNTTKWEVAEHYFKCRLNSTFSKTELLLKDQVKIKCCAALTSTKHVFFSIFPQYAVPLYTILHLQYYTAQLYHCLQHSYCTLMISTSWSTPLSPGKMGWPSSSSANTQPADQMSILDV